jgi:predicted regulator of Ras-like GTPase activity (Roadblock/LC7/MglB family)
MEPNASHTMSNLFADRERIHSLLDELSGVPGVVGSLVSDAEGRLVGHAFPKLFDAQVMEEAAKIVSDASAGLEAVTGSLSAADFRFGELRLFVRQLNGAALLILCAKSVNLQLLTISSSVAARKIEKLLAEN